MTMSGNERLHACRILSELLAQHGSLATHLNDELRNDPAINMALLREYCYGVCRWYHRLDAWAAELLNKPLKRKDRDVYCLILLGLYQLFHMRTPEHAAVNETVAVCDALNKSWARGLVNALLRKAQRSEEPLRKLCEADYSCLYSHPQWLLDRLKKDWPREYRAIMNGNNAQAPMTLRLGPAAGGRDAYLQRLQEAGLGGHAGAASATAVYLDRPVDVYMVPGFVEGQVSVQDEASQLVAELLQLRPGMTVLDACAAPGGKACALLEKEPQLDLTCLDSDDRRLERLRDNLERCRLRATVACADITADAPFRNEQFELILLDVPCSGTGVIRRHPDIKLLRSEQEVSALAQTQRALLDAAWPLLAPGGKLLYTTCSVLREENEEQIAAFLQAIPQAREAELTLPSAALRCKPGYQLLPAEGANDGFYYALLEKC